MVPALQHPPSGPPTDVIPSDVFAELPDLPKGPVERVCELQGVVLVEDQGRAALSPEFVALLEEILGEEPDRRE